MRIFFLLPIALLGGCGSSAQSSIATSSTSTVTATPPPVVQQAPRIAPEDAAEELVRKELSPKFRKLKFDEVQAAHVAVCGYFAPLTERGKRGDLIGTFQPFIVVEDKVYIRAARLDFSARPSEQEDFYKFGRKWSEWCGRPLV